MMNAWTLGFSTKREKAEHVHATIRMQGQKGILIKSRFGSAVSACE
jgi:hypothetical protein